MWTRLPGAGAIPLAQGGDEIPVRGEPDPVGVDVDRADGPFQGYVDEFEEVLVDGRLAAGEHDHLGLAFGGHEDVEHLRALLAGYRVAVGLVAGVGEADRAVEVAPGVDLDDAQACVLLVLGAQPAVRRAAVFDLGLELERDGAGLVEPP
nr:hypothetical protein [Glycomyces salinus]